MSTAFVFDYESGYDLRSTMNQKPIVSVLFLCTGNSCRSQMAEGFVRHWTAGRIHVQSAGTHPADEVSPYAIKVMSEIGIDISDHYTKPVGDFVHESLDWVITVCDFANAVCPTFQPRNGAPRRLHWSVRDPHTSLANEEKHLEAYREVRDDLARRIKKWLLMQYGIVVED